MALGAPQKVLTCLVLDVMDVVVLIACLMAVTCLQLEVMPESGPACASMRVETLKLR